MSRVLVIELHDTATSDANDFSEAMKAVQDALGLRLGGAHVYGAVAEDADKILSVFGEKLTIPAKWYRLGPILRWFCRRALSQEQPHA